MFLDVSQQNLIYLNSIKYNIASRLLLGLFVLVKMMPQPCQKRQACPPFSCGQSHLLMFLCLCTLLANVETSLGIVFVLGRELRSLPRRFLQMGVISMQMVVETCRCTPLHSSYSSFLVMSPVGAGRRISTALSCILIVMWTLRASVCLDTHTWV